jgi:hypothetical protein
MIASASPKLRQQLLFLYLSHPSPDSQTVGWSLFDGSGREHHDAGTEDTPPYASVVAAMREGWRVLQVARQEPPALGLEQRTSFLPYEFVLERLVEIDHE